MSIWDRYLGLKVLVMAAVAAPGLAGLYLVGILFQRIDDLIRAGVPPLVAARYLLLRLPAILYQLSPLVILLAGLMTIMLTVKSREMVAARCVGLSPVRAAAPVVAGALLLALIFLLLDLQPVPAASRAAAGIWRAWVDKRPVKGLVSGEGFFYRGHGRFWKAAAVSGDGRELRDVVVLGFDREFRPTASLYARRARFDGKGWVFSDGMEKVYGERGPVVTPFHRLERTFPERPGDFVAVETPAEQVDLIPLMVSIFRMREYGLDATGLEARFWSRLLYPFLGVSLMAAVLPVVTVVTTGGLALGMALSMVLGLGCWFVWGLLVTLGKTGALPPAMGPLLLHLVLVAVSLVGAWRRSLW